MLANRLRLVSVERIRPMPQKRVMRAGIRFIHIVAIVGSQERHTRLFEAQQHRIRALLVGISRGPSALRNSSLTEYVL